MCDVSSKCFMSPKTGRSCCAGRPSGAGRQVHDVNIVATMLEHGIYRLLTFNAADFKRFVGIIELEPPQ
jgi:hypothetical protein